MNRNWISQLALKESLYKSLLPLSSTVLLLFIWQIAVQIYSVPKWLLPSPLEVISSFWDFRNELLRHTLATLRETVIGVLLAVVLSIPLALIMASSDRINRAISPILVGINSIPKTAVAPLLLIWVGTGEAPKIALACLISFFPIIVNTLAGMLDADQDMVDLVRSLGGNKFKVMVKIRIPNALPHMFSSFKVAVSLAIVGTVIGEFVGSDVGLGYMILIASSQMKTALAFSCIGLLAVMGIVLFNAINLIERFVMPWHITSSDHKPQI